MRKKRITAILLTIMMLTACSGETKTQTAAISGEGEVPASRVEELEQKNEALSQSNAELELKNRKLEQLKTELTETNKMLQEQCSKIAQSAKAEMFLGDIKYFIPAEWITTAGKADGNEIYHFPNEKNVLVVQVRDLGTSFGQEPAEEEQKGVAESFYAGYLSRMENAEEGEVEHTTTQDGTIAMKGDIYSDTKEGRVKDTLYQFMKGKYLYVLTFRSQEIGIYDEALQQIIDSITFREYQEDTEPGAELETESDTASPADVNDPNITMEEYNRIENGMSYKQVVEIVGSEGTEMAASSVNGYTIAIYSWYGNKAAGSNANVTITNGKVSGKAQVGLK